MSEDKTETNDTSADTTTNDQNSGADTSVENTETVDTSTDTPQPLGAGGEGDDVPHTPAPTWPDDWREKLAGNDEEALKALKRFKDPSNVFKSYKALRAKMDAGELKSAMPDPSNEEAMKAWREENGIPESPEGYLEVFGDEITEEDRPVVDKYLAEMHAAGVTPDQAKKGIDAYFEVREQLIEKAYEEDKAFRTEAEEELRAEWGPEFRANLNSMRNMLNAANPELQEIMFTARTHDGRLLGDNPEFLRFLVSMNSELNPHGTVTPNAGETPVQTIENEINNIEQVMKTDSRKYWNDEGMQKRYGELLAMRDRYAA